MKSLLSFILSQLGIGVGATNAEPNRLKDNFHKIFGNEISIVVNESTLHITYEGKTTTIEYKIVDNTVKDINIKQC